MDSGGGAPLQPYDSEVMLNRTPVAVPDGTTFRLIHARNHGGADQPVILCIPAMGVNARYYEPLLKALHAAGLHAATFDLRGNGESTVRASRSTDFGYHEILTRDLP